MPRSFGKCVPQRDPRVGHQHANPMMCCLRPSIMSNNIMNLHNMYGFWVHLYIYIVFVVRVDS